MKFSTAAKPTQVTYGTGSQLANFEQRKNATVVATIANHKTMISANAQPGWCKPKKIHAAYAIKDWASALEYADGLLGWLERGGFPPQPTIDTTTGEMMYQLDADLSRSIAHAASQHILDQCMKELGHAA